MTPVSNVFTESPEESGPAASGDFPADYCHRTLTFAFAIATVMLCSNSILMLSPWCKSVLAFIAFTALVLHHSLAEGGTKCLIRLVLHVGGMYAALRLESGVARVVAVSWLLLSLELSRHVLRGKAGATGRSDGLVEMHWAGLAYAGFLICYGRIDGVWFALRRFGEILPGRTPVGFWAAGFQVYLIGAMAGLAPLASGRVRAGRRNAEALTRSGVIVVTLGLALVAGRSILAMIAPVGHLDVSILHMVAVAVVSLIVAGIRFRLPGTGRIALVSAMLMAVLLLTGLVSSRPDCPPVGAGKVGGFVGICSEGLLDWRVPDMEKLGLANSGMFGLFREDLEQWTCPLGGRVVVSDSVSDEFLSGLRVLVFINPSRRPSPGEIAGIERFVREGNGLLVLGDHTDIGDSREPLNAILAFTGIQFNYDSAIPHRHGWQGCLEIRRHPVTRSVVGDLMVQAGIGASLEIKRPAIPVIIARYGFSDAGDSTNGGRGGFMGNTVHEGGEQVGGLVLAACRHVGRGRVLVFGDTSPFQNAALFLSGTLVRNSVEWLQGDHAIPAGSGPLCLAAGGSGAILDFSLKPDVSLEPFSDRSLGGLANCLARAGVSAVPALKRSQWDREAPFLFLVNPTEEIGTPETDWLCDYMASGGNVILAKGCAVPQPAESLMLKMGLKVNPIPLGSGDSTSSLAHKEAWALSLIGMAQTEIRSRAFGYPTAVTRRVGGGTFTLIADGRLFLDGNLESEWRGNPKNITFITGLIEELRENSSYAEAETN